MVGRSAHEICRIGRKNAIPHPPLVTAQRFAEFVILHVPHFDRLVRGGGREVLGVGAVNTMKNVGFVGIDLGDRIELGVVLELPHVTMTLVVRSHHLRSCGRDAETSYRHLSFRDVFARASVFGEIPNSNGAVLKTADELCLVGMQNDGIYRRATVVISLTTGRPDVPQLDGAVFRTGEHPFPFSLETERGNVCGVAFETGHGGRVAGVDLEEANVGIARSGEVLFVGRDGESVDL